MPRSEVRQSRSGQEDGFVHQFLSKGTPDRTLRIDDPGLLRVFYEPLRQKILAILGEPMSVKGLAEELGDTANHLYYHVRLLEKAGFIEVVDQRIVGSNVERLYARAASRYELAPELWAEGAMLAAPIIDEQRDGILERYGQWLAEAEKAVAQRIRDGGEQGLRDLPVPVTLTMKARVSP